MLFQIVSFTSQVNSLHVLDTLGTMCNLSLGVWETHLHTFCPNFFFLFKYIYIYIYMCVCVCVCVHVHVYLKILVD
jgi:hypothetical protein